MFYIKECCCLCLFSFFLFPISYKSTVPGLFIASFSAYKLSCYYYYFTDYYFLILLYFIYCFSFSLFIFRLSLLKLMFRTLVNSCFWFFVVYFLLIPNSLHQRVVEENCISKRLKCSKFSFIELETNRKLVWYCTASLLGGTLPDPLFSFQWKSISLVVLILILKCAKDFNNT